MEEYLLEIKANTKNSPNPVPRAVKKFIGGLKRNCTTALTKKPKKPAINPAKMLGGAGKIITPSFSWLKSAR